MLVTDDQGRLISVRGPWLTVSEAEQIALGGIVCDDEALAEARRVLYSQKGKS